jgi:Mn-containing catalase
MRHDPGLAASPPVRYILEVEGSGYSSFVLPSAVDGQPPRDVAYKFMSFSEGEESAQGRWAQGPSMDGKGEIEYVASPQAMGPEMGELDPPVEPRLYSTPKQPMPRPLPDRGRR